MVGAEKDRPLLENRFRSDGNPPFTEREREIHLNGTCGVKFYEKPGFDRGSRLSFLKTPNAEPPNAQFSKSERILVERWVLSVER